MQEIIKITKRTVTIKGRQTSVSLEDPFWNALKEIAKNRNVAVSKIVQEVHESSKTENLSSAIRLYAASLLGSPRVVLFRVFAW